MKYTITTTLDKFQPWSGGYDNWIDLKYHDAAFNFISNYLDHLTYTEELSETQINDFLWFDMPDLLIEEGYMDENGDWTKAVD